MVLTSILVERRGAVGLVTLNRPQALNALNSTLLGELLGALEAFEREDDIGAVVITGSAKAFAAGADIREMSGQSFAEVFSSNLFADAHDRFVRLRKPIVAAVAGFALGGGCELAMLCDFIIAADTARFGQPEITLGVIPGLGGSQRLTRFVGKSKAMEMCLTGRMMDAAEAERSGLVSRVVPADTLIDVAIEAAASIAAKSRLSVMMAKEAVNRVYEASLSEGVVLERRLFHALFATEDQKEGMAAFLEKRKPVFKNR